ncbi:MAG: ABC transporter permease [bacterium]
MKLFKQFNVKDLSFALACPAVIWQAFFLYFPLILLFMWSLLDYSPETGRYFFTFQFYSMIFSTTYFKAIINSVVVALITASICFILAYPIAYFLAMKINKRYRPFLLFSLVLPSWTSFIIQVYAWFFLLDKNGFVSRSLYTLGILPESWNLLNNYFSILIGMVCVYLPFMILPLYTVLEKIDKSIIEASADLGAHRLETFKRIIFPLSLPGVSIGFLLVFLPAFGEFVIPTLLGGSKFAFWGSIIKDKFLETQDWKTGASLSSLGIMFPIIIIAFVFIVSKVITAFKKLNQQSPSIKQQHPKDRW